MKDESKNLDQEENFLFDEDDMTTNNDAEHDPFADDDFDFSDEDDSALAPESTPSPTDNKSKKRLIGVVLILVALILFMFGIGGEDNKQTITPVEPEQTTQTDDVMDMDDMDNMDDTHHMDTHDDMTAPEEKTPAAVEPITPDPMADVAVTPADPTPVIAEIDWSHIEHRLDVYERQIDHYSKQLDASDETVLGKLNAIETHVGNMTQEINALKNHVRELESAVDESDQSFQVMNHKIQVLGDTVHSDENQMLRAEAFTNPDFHVHAVIPGRAWLKRRDGTIVTVTEGDVIGDYGKVLAIDAPASSVMTSSGVTFR